MAKRLTKKYSPVQVYAIGLLHGVTWQDHLKDSLRLKRHRSVKTATYILWIQSPRPVESVRAVEVQEGFTLSKKKPLHFYSMNLTPILNKQVTPILSKQVTVEKPAVKTSEISTQTSMMQDQSSQTDSWDDQREQIVQEIDQIISETCRKTSNQFIHYLGMLRQWQKESKNEQERALKEMKLNDLLDGTSVLTRLVADERVEAAYTEPKPKYEQPTLMNLREPSFKQATLSGLTEYQPITTRNLLTERNSLMRQWHRSAAKMQEIQNQLGRSGNKFEHLDEALGTVLDFMEDLKESGEVINTSRK